MYRNKRVLFLSLIIALLVLIPIIGYLTFTITSYERKRNSLLDYIRKQEYQLYIPQDKLLKSLNIIENPNSSPQQSYDELKRIAFYLQDYYYKENHPSTRKLLVVLDGKAKETFPKEYDSGDFTAACADPVCGEKPDEEVKDILESIKNLKVDDLYIRIITTNLENAIYVPYDTSENKIDKLSLYNLAYLQLLELGVNEASSSAENLSLYVKNKYKKDVGDIQSFTKDL